jgi:preprotein translocase subunit SecE
LQTTLTVFVFVLIMGIFFWVLDFLLLFLTNSITS